VIDRPDNGFSSADQGRRKEVNAVEILEGGEATLK
jgi:hypothetical protein